MKAHNSPAACNIDNVKNPSSEKPQKQTALDTEDVCPPTKFFTLTHSYATT